MKVCAKCGEPSGIIGNGNSYCHSCRGTYNRAYYRNVVKPKGRHYYPKPREKKMEEPKPIRVRPWTALLDKPYTSMTRTEMKEKARTIRALLNW